MDPSSAKLEDSEAVVKLRKMLSNPIDMMILPKDKESFINDSLYTPIFTADTRGDADNLREGFFASVRCADGTVSASVPTLGNQTIPGVDQFVERLKGLGPEQVTRGDCANTVDCS